MTRLRQGSAGEKRATVFNIGDNKFRLIAAIHDNRKNVYVRHVLTHADYDRNTWRT